MSWHYNEWTQKSSIQQMIDLLDESNFIEIYMINDDNFFVTVEDEVFIGDGAMLISSVHQNGDKWAHLINTKYIYCIELRPSKKD